MSGFHLVHRFDPESAYQDYLDGMSLTEIAAKCNLHPDVIYDTFLRRGYKVRTRAEAARVRHRKKRNESQTHQNPG